MIRRFLLPLALLILALFFWWNPSFIETAAGVAVLLFGMILLENGFRIFAEGPFKKFLKKATNKLYKSVIVGTVSTAVLQSSSLISVITISFISAGLLDLIAGIGIIFGANLGTTATAWLVAIFGLKIEISTLAMPMLVFGVILYFQKKLSYQGMGSILVGMGFLFLGIFFMKQGFDSFSSTIELSQYQVNGIIKLLVFMGIGLLSTVVLQSSSAAMAIILTALSAGQIAYIDAISLAIGANVGTTITAIIGAAASNVAGKRVAIAHLVFNMITALLALVLIYQFIWVVDILAVKLRIAPEDYTLKLAIFHTLFNLLGVLVMYPFVHFLAKLLMRIVPDVKDHDIDEPKFLSESALLYSASAIEALKNETEHLIRNVIEIIAHGLRLHKHEVLSDKSAKDVVTAPFFSQEVDINLAYLQKVKRIYSKIIEFATLAQKAEMLEADVETIYHMKEANRYLVEVVKDIEEIQPNMMMYLQSDNIHMREEYNTFRKRIIKTIRSVYNAKLFAPSPEMTNEHIETLLGKQIERRSVILEGQKQKIKQHDVLFNGTLDRLIREKSVSSSMASSLNNDSATVARICLSLIHAAELLYLDSDLVLMNGAKPDEE